MKLDHATFWKKLSDSKNEEKSLLNVLLILGDSYRNDNNSHLLSDVQISQKKCYIYVYDTAGWVINAKTSEKQIKVFDSSISNFYL